MDMDLEYSRFMAELDAVPSGPATEAQPVSNPGETSQQNGENGGPVRPNLPPPPLDATGIPPPGPSQPSTLPLPPGRPPALPAAPTDAASVAAAPSTRPSGPPPPLSTPAVFSAPAQPPSQPAYEPPSYLPPSINNSYKSSYGYSGGAQNGASTSAQQSFDPSQFNAQAIRDEILGEKKDGSKKKKKPKEGVLRAAGGETWIDDKMDFWDKDDFRIFVGNLGPEVNEDALQKAFQHFPSYSKCRIVKDYKKNKAKGYGFVSFVDQTEGIKALKQMNGKYIGNRPCQLKKSSHDARNVPDAGQDSKKRKAMLANPMGRITTKRMR